jgi:transcriptional regulator with XRE-family HTH domain
MKLDAYLTRHKLTQVEFARASGISQPTIARLVRGTRRPSLAMIERIHTATHGRVTARDWIEPGKPE